MFQNRPKLGDVRGFVRCSACDLTSLSVYISYPFINIRVVVMYLRCIIRVLSFSPFTFYYYM